IRALKDSPPSSLYTAAQVRSLDQAAIVGGTPGIQLMKRAGRAAFDLLLERFGAPTLISVYAGGGNNAGDGFVLAGLAAQRRLPVEVVALVAPDKLTGDARLAYEFAVQEGVQLRAFDARRPPVEGVIVDALLGIGLSGEP